MQFRMAGLADDSIVDGPGIRFTVFVQGCPFHCEGCHNPQTHDFNGGALRDTEEILQRIKKNPLLDGVTLSGGEPFCQAAAMAEIAEGVHKLGLNVVCYTGNTFEALLERQDPDQMRLLQSVDILIDGQFVLAQRSLALLFRGSKNQRILDCPASLAQGKAVEIPEEKFT